MQVSGPLDISPSSMKNHLLELAQSFLWNLKTNEPTDHLVTQLADLQRNHLFEALAGNDAKKVFWTNLYNAYNLLLMRDDPEVNANRKNRMKHFKKRQIQIAGEKVSLMDIENGFLRRSKVWWGLGYLRRWKVSQFERRARVDDLDPRIHFALNCGALSCPPIRFYTLEGIDHELDLATRSYLASEVRQGKGNQIRTLFVSSLFRAYRGDFKGTGGIMAFIKSYKKLPEEKFKIRFISWDSSMDLDDFKG